MASSSDDHGGSKTNLNAQDAGVFDKWRRKFSMYTGVPLGIPEEQVRADQMEYYHRTRENWKKELLHYSPGVVFMLKHLRQLGSPLPPENIRCEPCLKSAAGGFAPEINAIYLCQNNIINKRHMEVTLMHELIHLYDNCKFKLDWQDLRHQACTEIRANNLSGNCWWSREKDGNPFSFTKQHQACVRRRAIMSVRQHPACPDDVTAERVVNEVWESCFNDTRPFDEIY
ncbi:hypothetical protein CERSUDRAFT_110830 [Gelatoporia subvermispora B]|uniref:Mitochondrial inner membrane protease ATP23 n=1 Tax=Ceriporiopsis subvermispora (strain B) TaxID=914234 RepID=M2RCZ4_CERS8|nr:hypothetical protein CERSUDRAFT_110830 [Gelatoporia subvermispora B]